MTLSRLLLSLPTPAVIAACAYHFEIRELCRDFRDYRRARAHKADAFGERLRRHAGDEL